MTVKEAYDSFGGNYNLAVQTMMNDVFITKMLSKFTQSNSYQSAIDAYQNKNYRGVFEACHSLKGVCGNLALTPLYDKASVICEKTRNLKENESVNFDLEIEDLTKTYTRVLSFINSLINQ